MLWFCHRLQHAERCLNQHRILVLNQKIFVTLLFARQPAINKQTQSFPWSHCRVRHAKNRLFTGWHDYQSTWIYMYRHTHTHTNTCQNCPDLLNLLSNAENQFLYLKELRKENPYNSNSWLSSLGRLNADRRGDESWNINDKTKNAFKLSC
jgi:hypothetical protein